jgi:hypothetical protein
MLWFCFRFPFYLWICSPGYRTCITACYTGPCPVFSQNFLTESGCMQNCRRKTWITPRIECTNNTETTVVNTDYGDQEKEKHTCSKQSTLFSPRFLSFSGAEALFHLTSKTLLTRSCCLYGSRSHSSVVSGVRATWCIASSTSPTVTPSSFLARIFQRGSKSHNM